MRNLKLIFSIFLIIFCLIFSIFVYANQIATTQDGKEVLLKSDGTWEYIRDQPQESYKTFKIGTTIRIDNFQFCLNSARFSNKSMFSPPEPGCVWLILNCTITNLSNKNDTVPGFGLTLRDKEGYSQGISFSAETKGHLSGTMSPGQTIRGEVAYEVKIEQSYWEFFFEPGFLDLSHVIYSIEKEEVE